MTLEIKLRIDADPPSPREFDNLGKMVCFHQRYILGDPHPDVSIAMIGKWADLEVLLRRTHQAAVLLPLYLYDHSGLSISTRPFSCPWDSGQVGYIYATHAAIKAYMGFERLTVRRRQAVQKALEAEVRTYNYYVAGDTWGFQIFDAELCQEVSSCWGFYGEDDARQAAQTELAYYNRRQLEQAQQQAQQFLGWAPRSLVV